MAQLFGRPGDAQAIKVLACASLVKQSVEFLAQPDVKSVRAKQTNPFGSNTIAFLHSETAVTEPNSAIRFIGASNGAASAAVDQWLDWEEQTLRPAVLKGDTASALEQLQATLAGKDYLLGSSPSPVDVSIACTLLPLKVQGKVPTGLHAYVDRVAALPCMTEALQKVLSDSDMGIIAKVFKEDSAAFVASVPRVPIPGQRNILITSALPYVNNVPHLGNIIGCVLSADCYARYCRSRGHNCIYVCGTDEYGTATETKALEENLSCAQICDKYHAIHKGIYDWFDIEFDKFGRTPTGWQTKIAQDIFGQLQQHDNLVEQSMEQLYSEAAGKFLADRFVTGTCPKCKYEDARGDQCDACGQLLNPTELINPKCKITGTTPVIRPTQHIFLDLPKLSDDLQNYITTTSQLGGWSSNCVQVTNAWMRDGLKLRCITRDLKWGTPVPAKGYEEKVFYVWFDAPIGYISITANYTPDWEKWWKNPEDVELVQFMGKDNVPFHTVIFPASLIGSRDKWTMMKNISVTEYLNYEGGKFSKSRGTGVFGNDARDTGIPVEVWRYYLLSNRPEQSDTDFKWSDLAARNNSELLANIGNFVNRALMFVAKFFDGKNPAATDAGKEAVAEFGATIAPKVQEYIAAMEKIKIKEGIRLAMSISADGNKFFQDQKPWVLVKENIGMCATVVAAGVGLVRLLAALINPYMPSLTRKMLAQLNLPESAVNLTDDLISSASDPTSFVPAGHVINPPQPLVAQIPEELIEQLKARFGGSQADRGVEGAPANKDSGAKGKGGKDAGKGAVKGDKAAKPKAPVDPDRAVDVSRLDIRVGLIKKAWRHPDAESLYVEEIDVGEDKPRQVVSGLVKHIPEDKMQNRLVAVLCNLKPSALRGVESQAMVLAATASDGSKTELVEPPAGAKIGERIAFEGYSGEPDEQLNPKKKIFEACQPDLAVNEGKIACYKGIPFTTSKGPCTVASITAGYIK